MSTLHDELRAILAIPNQRARAAALDALRIDFGAAEVDTALAALEPAPDAPRPSMAMEASAGGSIASSPMTSAGGDVRDNALGSGNLVLHDITIAAGGTLAIGARR